MGTNGMSFGINIINTIETYRLYCILLINSQNLREKYL